MSTSGSPVGSFLVCPARPADGGSSRRSGLLRLFNSEFFDASMALGYLLRYNHDEAGIQHAVCERLRERPPEELEFLLPQLCHFVVCNETSSPALEHLLLECLWYLENYLNDFGIVFGKNHRPYLRAARFLNDMHKALFMDHPWDYRKILNSPMFGQADGDGGEEEAEGMCGGRVPKHSASLVAAGCALAGLAVPEFAGRVRSQVMVESRSVSLGSRQNRAKSFKHHGRTGSVSSLNVMDNCTPSVDDLSSGRAFSLRHYLVRAAKQINASAPTLMMLSSSLRASTTLSESSAKILPPSIPLYYFAEMQFVMSLIDVAARLVMVPRPGRLKALAAELTLINHNLPASLCLPLWCGGKVGGGAHHRVLRICPTDAVVLNSAERVPFLFHLEVLESDCTEEQFQDLCRSCSDARLGSSKGASQSCIDDEVEESVASARAAAAPEDDVPNSSQSPEEQQQRQSSVASPPVPRNYSDEDLAVFPLSADDFSERMRTAAIMLAQLTRQASQPGCPVPKLADIAAIKERIMREMELLEKNRLLDALQGAPPTEQSPAWDPLVLDQRAHFDKDDPSAAVFQQDLRQKTERLRAASPYGRLEGWKLLSVIVKSGADMRQEQLACQIVAEMKSIWERAGLTLWTYSYRVLVASANGGLIETVPDAISLHSIKKNAYVRNRDAPNFVFSLRDHFIKTFGSPDSDTFQRARLCFAESLAAYSLATYLLQIKDRHDGNILLDREGHLVHIDFGFMLSNSPGYVGFESAPFKLTPEYVELLGGLHSPEFARFKELLFQGFLELRKHHERIIVLVEGMLRDSRLPCFHAGEAALAHLRQRFHVALTEGQLRQVIERLVISSAFNVFTKLYDTFQYYSNGVL